ncbi:MAG: FHA domain-containing protein [Lentisphaerae bacterium]|nr:FHA domain-containing protein [Lentisphaerota bacterium]
MASAHPQPALVPVTPEAIQAVGTDHIPLAALPFRVGRESRYGVMHGKVVSMERRQSAAAPNNNLYLLDNAEFLNVSREHFLIERKPDGSFEVVDRGSTCGTIVDDQAAGGESSIMRRPLRHGSLIRVGTPTSPFLFRFVIDGSQPEA